MEETQEESSIRFSFPAYPSIFISDTKCKEGDKIILPEFVLKDLMHNIGSKRPLPNPVIYRIENKAKSKISHCGVLEYNAFEPNAYMPQWMMDNLLLQPGDIVNFTLEENFPKLNFVCLKPLTNDFFDNFDNPKSILENALQKFTVLTLGDTFLIKSSLKADFTFLVEKIEPKIGNPPFGCIVDADLNVEFKAPISRSSSFAQSIEPNKEFNGEIKKNENIYYSFLNKAKNMAVKFQLESVFGDVDIYISKYHKANSMNNQWENYEKDLKTKELIIPSEDCFNSTLNITLNSLHDFSQYRLIIILLKENAENENKITENENLSKENKEKCENCRQLINKNSLSMHLMRCKRLNWYCEDCNKIINAEKKDEHFHCEKCKAETTKKGLEKHNTIKHKLVQCQCGVFFEPINFLKHMKTCSFKNKNCKFCKTPFHLGDLDAHETVCGSRTQYCEICNEFVPISRLNNHNAIFHQINPSNPFKNYTTDFSTNFGQNKEKKDENITEKDKNGAKIVSNDKISPEEQLMIDQAISNSMADNVKKLPSYKENENQTFQKCPYCNKELTEDVDIGIHMLNCPEA